MTQYRSQTEIRRRPLFRIEPEALEGRLLLTGGGGNTIGVEPSLGRKALIINEARI